MVYPLARWLVDLTQKILYSVYLEVIFVFFGFVLVCGAIGEFCIPFALFLRPIEVFGGPRLIGTTLLVDLEAVSSLGVPIQGFQGYCLLIWCLWGDFEYL